MKKLLKGKVIVKFLLCIIWLSLIFYNGTRQGEVSQKSSKQLVKIVTRFVNLPSTTLDSTMVKLSDLNFYVRKNAHFFQYLIFSILLCSAIRQFKLRKSSEIFLLLFLLLFFPVIDEVIQKYVPGRTSNVSDVIIDFSGGVLGILIFNFRDKIYKKKVEAQV